MPARSLGLMWLCLLAVAQASGAPLPARMPPGWQVTSPEEAMVHRAIQLRLQRKISVNFRHVPLAQVIQDLNSVTGLPIVPDRFALEEFGIKLEHPISFAVQDSSADVALTDLLRTVGLQYVIKDRVIQIEPIGRLRR